MTVPSPEQQIREIVAEAMTAPMKPEERCQHCGGAKHGHDLFAGQHPYDPLERRRAK